MRWSWRIAAMLVPVAIALALVTTNVWLAVNSLTLWDALFDRYDVPQRTGITSEGLRSVGQQLQDYFDSDEEPLQVVANVRGAERPLFSNREALHMKDVKGLFHLTFRVQQASVLFLLLMAGGALFRFRGGVREVLSRWAQHGAALSAALVVVVGAVSVLAFGPLFELFHRISFRNDFWQLNSSTDFLVMIFPFGFWRDITLLIGLATLIEAALLFGLGRLLVRTGPDAVAAPTPKVPNASA